MGLRFGPTGLNPPAAAAPPPPPSGPAPADPNNYAGVFAQMMNMMSNQNLVGCFSSLLVRSHSMRLFAEHPAGPTLCCPIGATGLDGFHQP